LSLPLAFCALVAAAAPPTYRVSAEPRNEAETALRETLARGVGSPAPAVADSLARFAAARPGTASSGLARLAAGLALLDAQKTQQSLPFLTHTDLQQTLLADHATLALARAQEAMLQMDAAARSYMLAASTGSLALACTALPRAADAFVKAGAPAKAVEPLERGVELCAGAAPHLLARLGDVQMDLDRRAAALAYDRLDRDYPASPEAKDVQLKLAALQSLLPAVPPEQRAARALKKGLALLDAGRTNDAASAFRTVVPAALSPADADLLRVKYGRVLVALRRQVEAEKLLRAIPPASPHAAEAAYQLARLRYRNGSIAGYAEVVETFAGTPWAEECLLQLANEYQKDARDDDALPFWRRMVAEYPEGRYAERAAWRAGWADFRAGRYEAAAQALEKTARLRPPSNATAGFLYWSGRARAALGQMDRARQLYEETEQRYKYAYHGLRAREALLRLPPQPTTPVPALVAASADPPPELSEAQEERVRQLLLIDQLDAAQDELLALPYTRRGQATIAWIDWRRGRLRPAITGMKRAFPEHVTEAGDQLPEEVWHILYPIEFEETLKAKAAEEGLDPALVAALILQESTFDAGALSRAGARGLMQVIPATGRKLARDLRVPYRRAALHDPKTSLDFGTRYLRQMSDRFDGQVERILAAYNAGPHRVDAWTALRPDMSAEEFIESIPFTETRFYVMIILATREQYRRLYGLEKLAPPPVEGARP